MLPMKRLKPKPTSLKVGRMSGPGTRVMRMTKLIMAMMVAGSCVWAPVRAAQGRPVPLDGQGGETATQQTEDFGTATFRAPGSALGQAVTIPREAPPIPRLDFDVNDRESVL